MCSILELWSVLIMTKQSSELDQTVMLRIDHKTPSDVSSLSVFQEIFKFAAITRFLTWLINHVDLGREFPKQNFYKCGRIASSRSFQKLVEKSSNCAKKKYPGLTSKLFLWTCSRSPLGLSQNFFDHGAEVFSLRSSNPSRSIQTFTGQDLYVFSVCACLLKSNQPRPNRT